MKPGEGDLIGSIYLGGFTGGNSMGGGGGGFPATISSGLV